VVPGGLKDLHKDELYNLYYSPNVTELTQSRNISWAGHAAGVENMSNV
jgi:hypothetical protein